MNKTFMSTALRACRLVRPGLGWTGSAQPRPIEVAAADPGDERGPLPVRHLQGAGLGIFGVPEFEPEDGAGDLNACVVAAPTAAMPYCNRLFNGHGGPPIALTKSDGLGDVNRTTQMLSSGGAILSRYTLAVPVLGLWQLRQTDRWNPV